MFRSLLNLLGSTLNRKKMSAWSVKVDHIVTSPPGTDEGFSQEEIERNSKADFSQFSTWEIICEEVLDTSHPRIYFERARMELYRRGIADDAYHKMRRIAWLTAGWLNFVKMLWDWCSLDESDIYRAIDWQYSEGWISKVDRDEWTRFTDLYARGSHP